MQGPLRQALRACHLPRRRGRIQGALPREGGVSGSSSAERGRGTAAGGGGGAALPAPAPSGSLRSPPSGRARGQALPRRRGRIQGSLSRRASGIPGPLRQALLAWPSPPQAGEDPGLAPRRGRGVRFLPRERGRIRERRGSSVFVQAGRVVAPPPPPPPSAVPLPRERGRIRAPSGASRHLPRRRGRIPTAFAPPAPPVLTRAHSA